MWVPRVLGIYGSHNKETITKKVTHNSVKEVSLESDDGIGPTNEFTSSLLHKYNHTKYAAFE